MNGVDMDSAPNEIEAGIRFLRTQQGNQTDEIVLSTFTKDMLKVLFIRTLKEVRGVDGFMLDNVFFNDFNKQDTDTRNEAITNALKLVVEELRIWANEVGPNVSSPTK